MLRTLCSQWNAYITIKSKEIIFSGVVTRMRGLITVAASLMLVLRADSAVTYPDETFQCNPYGPRTQSIDCTSFNGASLTADECRSTCADMAGCYDNVLRTVTCMFLVSYSYLTNTLPPPPLRFYIGANIVKIYFNSVWGERVNVPSQHVMLQAKWPALWP